MLEFASLIFGAVILLIYSVLRALVNCIGALFVGLHFADSRVKLKESSLGYLKTKTFALRTSIAAVMFSIPFFIPIVEKWVPFSVLVFLIIAARASIEAQRNPAMIGQGFDEFMRFKLIRSIIRQVVNKAHKHKNN